MTVRMRGRRRIQISDIYFIKFQPIELFFKN